MTIIKSNKVEEQIRDDSILIIGHVAEVVGRKVKVRVNKDKNASHLLYKGDILRNVSVGSYVKILKGFVEIIGKVEGEYTTTEKVIHEIQNKETSIIYEKEEDKISRFLEVSLFGHYEGEKFVQGIKEMPLIDNEVFLIDKQGFDNLHKFYDSKNEVINIGFLTEEPSQEIQVSINKLFASHIGIFGNTGSGKSNTLTKLYHELFKKMKDNKKFKTQSKFILIDFNGEYSDSNTLYSNKAVYSLTTREDSKSKLPIKEEDLLNVELLSILSEATEKTQRPFIRRVVKLYEKVFSSENPEEYFRNKLRDQLKNIYRSQNKDLAFSLLEKYEILLNKQLDENSQLESRNRLKWHGGEKNKSEKGFIPPDYGEESRDETMRFQLIDDDIRETFHYKAIEKYNFPDDFISKFIDFMYLRLIYDIFDGREKNDYIMPVIHRLDSKQKAFSRVVNSSVHKDIFENYNFVVIDLKNANLDIKKTIPLILIKKLYEEHKGDDNFKQKSLHIIVDEAHNILSDSSERESETWKDYRLETFEEIIKEGRKFNVFLTVASQRPYDISKTILSQLHNYFIHRLINDFDISAIHKTVAYLDRLSFESIPVLSVGSCFFSGLATNIPVKVSIELLSDKYQPKSDTVVLEGEKDDKRGIWKEQNGEHEERISS